VGLRGYFDAATGVTLFIAFVVGLRGYFDAATGVSFVVLWSSLSAPAQCIFQQS